MRRLIRELRWADLGIHSYQIELAHERRTF
jgi:hypothetical protein